MTLNEAELLDWLTAKIEESKESEKRERRFESIQGVSECVGLRSAYMELRGLIKQGRFDVVEAGL